MTKKYSNKPAPKPSQKFPKKDPHLKREAALYANPIPSREYILAYLKKIKKPANFKQLMNALGLKKPDEKEGLDRRLKAMLRDGQLVLNRNDCFGLIDQMSLIAGRVQGHRDGFGWFIPDVGKPDIFLHARQMHQVFDGDRVLVRVISKDKKRPEGAIVEVLERNTQQIVGKLLEEKGVFFVDPDSKSIVQDIIIPRDCVGKAKPGQFVVANITVQPSMRRQAQGEIIEVLGDQLTPGMEVELAIRAHELPFRFSPDVLSEIKNLPDAVSKDDLKEALKERKDLRDLPFVTIDGEDARDFDDAVFCEPLEKNKWRVLVAIADVAHYVKPDTALDTEAQLRGNSVYFPSRVIPMLPEKLSNELCSLKADCERLTMVCEMILDANGNMLEYHFDNAVIFSKARLTYTQVAAELNGENTIDLGLKKSIQNLHELFKVLFKQRQLRGAIDFETVETQILFDQDGKIDRIVQRHRNVAHRIIEEMMLLANQTTAHFLEKSALPTIYRVHDLPDDAKLFALRDFLNAFGLKLTGGDKPTALDYGKLLEKVAGRPDAHLIQTVMLRSMRQAIYTVENRGHFGLSYEGYCHFTSPIRRYPDLLIHRALKHAIAKRKASKFMYDLEKMESIAEHCSQTERRADKATRDATDWLKCDYMQDKVGETFDGIISDVTGFGIFVELKEIYVQGLLHVTALQNDYYQYDPAHHLMRGKASNKTYRLGDSIRVTVARVNLDDRQIDFVLDK